MSEKIILITHEVLKYKGTPTLKIFMNWGSKIKRNVGVNSKGHSRGH